MAQEGTQKKRVRIYSESGVVAVGLCTLLEEHNWIVEIAPVSFPGANPKEIQCADVILLDCELYQEWFQKVKAFVGVCGETPLLLLCRKILPAEARLLLQAGIRGIVNHNRPPAEICRALAQIRDGQTYVPTHLSGAILSHNLRKNDGKDSPWKSLSNREYEIVQLLSIRCTNQEIAERLGISTKTVESHLNNIKPKLGCTAMRELRDQVKDHFIASGI